MSYIYPINSTKSAIKYISAPCASGKTHEIVNIAAELVRDGNRVIIIQATIRLIEQTIRNEVEQYHPDILYTAIHSENVERKPVGVAIAEHLKCDPGCGELVFITHQALSLVPYWTRKRDIHLFIDEALEVNKFYPIRMPETHPLLTEHIEIHQAHPIYGQVVAGAKVEKMARNRKEDDIYNLLANINRTLSNKNWKSYVNAGQYEEMRRGQRDELEIHSVLKPELLKGFAGVFVVCANFESTMMYHLWTEMGVKFRRDVEFERGLRYQTHQNGHLVTIYYVSEHPWSKTHRQRSNNLDKFMTTARAFLTQAGVDQSNVVYAINKGEEDAKGLGTRMPNKPHGLNELSDRDHLVFFSSLLCTPSNFKFLRDMMGLTSDDIRDSIYHSSVYQAVMRTSIRDRNNKNPKMWIVPDKGAAEFLARLIPGARIKKIDAGIVEPTGKRPNRKPRTSDRERTAEHRARVRRKAMEDIVSHARNIWLQTSNQASAFAPAGYASASGTSPPAPARHVNAQNTNSALPGDIPTFKDTSVGEYSSKVVKNAKNCVTVISLNKEDSCDTLFGNPTPMTATSGGSLYCALSGEESYRAIGLFPVYENAPGLAEFFKWCHGRSLSRKNQAGLFCPSVFDPDKPTSTDTHRGYENIDHVGNVFFMDFDGGNMPPAKLPEYFPNIEMIVCNSYNHHPDRPRFRVIVPLSRQLATPENYARLFDMFVSKFRSEGYRSVKRDKGKLSGIDWSKRVSTSLFYLPCQAKNPEYSFFTYYTGDKRCQKEAWAQFDEKRQLLDPAVWLENGPVKMADTDAERLGGASVGPRGTRGVVNERVDEEAVTRALNDWRTHKEDPKKRGNYEFYRLALRLYAAGKGDPEIEQILNVEYAYGRHPKARRRQIKSIMQSLHKRGREMGRAPPRNKLTAGLLLSPAESTEFPPCTAVASSTRPIEQRGS
jgi:hypothetical protein